MDWIRQNNFLAAFGGIMLAGILGLGFYVFSSYKGYSAALESFDSKKNELQNLERKPLHPDPKNLEMVRARAETVESDVEGGLSKVIGTHPPLPPVMNIDQFNPRVNSLVAPITEKAGSLDIILPSGFYLGMDDYKGTLPEQGALQRLAWQLDGIAHLSDLVLDSGVSHFEQLKRYKSAWENKPKVEPKLTAKEKKAKEKRERRNRSRSGKKSAPVKSGPNLDTVMENARVRVKLTGSPESITKFLNLVSNDDKYFYWIRWAKIGNEKPSGPLSGELFQKTPAGAMDAEGEEVDPATPAEAPRPDPSAPAPPDPSAPAPETPDETEVGEGEESAPAPAPVPLTIETVPMIDIFPILGNERVSVDAVIDIVRFRDADGDSEAAVDEKEKDKDSDKPEGE